MIHLRVRRGSLALVAGAAVAASGVVAGLGSASAQGAPAAVPAAAPAVYLATKLEGKNEVAGGDNHAEAVGLLRVQGDQVAFAFRWEGLVPIAGHIHEAPKGVNGSVVVPFFGGALPSTVHAAVGAVTVTDAALLSKLRTDPGAFYENLHSATFPMGAVRGQLHKLAHPVDLNSVLHGGPLVSLLDGASEVQLPGAGDLAGHGTGLVDVDKSSIDFAFTWNGIGAPLMGHIHHAPAGVNGPIVVHFFDASPGGLPPSFTGIAGTTTDVTRAVAEDIREHPGNFYTNLHTRAFPAGAIRGQLFAAGEEERNSE